MSRLPGMCSQPSICLMIILSLGVDTWLFSLVDYLVSGSLGPCFILSLSN